MFGLFKQRCPLRTAEKAWIELRMSWLAQKLGLHRLLDAKVILPTEEFFSAAYQSDEASARELLGRVCGYMGVNPGTIGFEVCEDVELPGVAGHYDSTKGTIIRVARSQLVEPLRLVATLAHEVAHAVLLGQGLLTGGESDHEKLTDLLPLYLGLGIFAANATVSHSSGFTGSVSWWRMSRQGYLPSRMFGYAFALFAHVRQEEAPAWREHLRLDARAVMEEGLRYLKQSSDTLFRLDRLGVRADPPTEVELTEWLGSSSATFRLAALMELQMGGSVRADLAEAVMQCLTDPDPDVPGWAAGTLSLLGPLAAPALPRLLHLLERGDESGRAGAATALGALRLGAAEVIPALIACVALPGRASQSEAMMALAAFGTEAGQAAQPVMAALVHALVEVDDPLSGVAAFALLRIVPDIKEFVREYFEEGDRELRRRAWEAIKEQHRLRKEVRRQQAPALGPSSSGPDQTQGGIPLL